MSVTIGRLSLEDPEDFSEPVGNSLGQVGGLPVPGQRAGISPRMALTSFDASGGSASSRQKIRRQLRGMLNNLTYRLGPIWLAWSEDTENSGWYALGATSVDPADVSGLVSAYWRFSPELTKYGASRTHRLAVSCYVRDRRSSTVPRDYRQTVFSTDFSTLSALSLIGLPSTTSDHVLHGATTAVTLATAASGYGSSSIRRVVGAGDLGVVSFEQAEANRTLGDVVIYDRQGTTTMLTTGPQTVWEEVYGPDHPLTASDVPVIENGLCRVSYDVGNTDGFRIDVWTGAAWAEQGKATIQRYDGSSWADLDTLTSATVAEWTQERGVLRVWMTRAADAYSRDEVIITLQRGWRGPRIEVYPARTSAGAVAGAGVSLNAVAAATAHSAATIDASDAGAITATAGSGGLTLSAANLGASTFTGENWVSLIREGESYDLALAALQAGAGKLTGSGSGAYGATRNFVQVRHQTAGYVSAHIGVSPHDTHEDLENTDFTASAGTTLGTADGTAYGGTAASTTRTAAANHVTLATFATGKHGTYRIFARVRTTASTLNINAQTGAGFGVINGVTKNDASPVTTTSTAYVWLDLGTVTAAATTLTIRMWATAAATTYLDRVEAHPLLLRQTANLTYDGPRDLGQSVLYDARPQPTLVAR